MEQIIKNAKILITGGGGLIGSHIVDQLIDEKPAEIRVLDNFSRGTRQNLIQAQMRYPVSIINGDIREQQVVHKAVAGCDYIIHQAAIRITKCAENPRECIDVLATGTFNVLEAAAQYNVKKVVYASSASVYGAADVYPTPESHHFNNNRTLYGAAKAFNEGMATAFSDTTGLDTVGLRYFNVYGPRMDLSGIYTEVFIRWIESAFTKSAPVIHGDGSASMDFIYVDDVARANILALKSPIEQGIFNIASGTETTLLELWTAICTTIGVTGIQPEFAAQRKVNAVPRRLADTRHAEQMLGFSPRVSLKAGLQKLLTWWNSMQTQGVKIS